MCVGLEYLHDPRWNNILLLEPVHARFVPVQNQKNRCDLACEVADRKSMAAVAKGGQRHGSTGVKDEGKLPCYMLLLEAANEGFTFSWEEGNWAPDSRVHEG